MIAKLSTAYLALSYGISGSNLIYREVFSLVYNMYKTAKECASSDGRISDTCPCLVGVRQGENLTPLLFSIYLGDLQLFLQDAHKGLAVVNKMTKDRLDESSLKYLELYVLLYADDTVLVAESAEDLQKSITLTRNYCDLWKLKINVTKPR